MNITDRFLNYTRINTTTNRGKGAAGIMPSSDGQMELAQLLAQELETLGMQDIVLRETAILTATLPSNIPVELLPNQHNYSHRCVFCAPRYKCRANQ